MPYILIVLIFVQLLAPFTIGSGVKINKAEADSDISVKITEIYLSNELATIMVDGKASDSYRDSTLKDYDDLFLVIKINNEDGTLAQPEYRENISNAIQNLKKVDVSKVGTFENLTPLTSYIITATIEGIKGGTTSVLATSASLTKKTLGADKVFQEAQLGEVDVLPVCVTGIANVHIGGCIAQVIYYLFFKPTSLFFALTGKILDFTFMYSISDTSYRSGFVVQGWGIVRDFCNMFFIFILLYIAFGTILKLHSVKTKEMIINVVIIGLLINFSLFATQVIIDASNILTRVFYNQNTIAVGPPKLDANGSPILDANGKSVIDNKLGDFNEIKLSEAIVNKTDPQELILNAEKVDTIPIKNPAGEDEENTTKKGITAGSFIIITLLATVVNVVGSIAFLSSALIFIARVVMLWLAMILAPLAFFTYTVPALQGIDMIGWKKWWPDTLKMAFVAPVFGFFMYIIVAFLGKGLDVVNASMKTGAYGLTWVISITVPFVFIMILLMQAKKIAVKMSGEFGAAMSKAGGAVGGLALGAATGGAAMLMRGTVGRLGNKLATSEWASTHGALGRTLGNAGKWTGSKSFDFKATKLGAAAGKSMDVDMGKAKEGGYTKHLSDKVEKRQKRAKELEVHENEKKKQDLNKTENDLQGLLVTNAKEIESVDKLIEKKRQEAADAERNLKAAATPTEIANAKLELKKKNNQLAEVKERKTALREGKAFSYIDDSGVLQNCDYDVSAKIGTESIDSLEKLQKTQAQDIKTENATRKGNYARAKASWGGRANKEAEHKIIMDAKMDSGTKV